MTKAVHTWAVGLLNLVLLQSTVTTVPLFAQEPEHSHQAAPAQLVEDVRKATRRFLDVNNAGPAGYGPALGCVTGPDHGAMGIHYVNGDLVGDGKIEKEYPEALIYEPVGNARRVVGVAYIVDAATWFANHSAPPLSTDRISVRWLSQSIWARSIL